MTSDSDEVRALALWHFDCVARGSAVPLILLQYRPQVIAMPGSVPVMADTLMANLRAAGWESPVLMFRGTWPVLAGWSSLARCAPEMSARWPSSPSPVADTSTTNGR